MMTSSPFPSLKNSVWNSDITDESTMETIFDPLNSPSIWLPGGCPSLPTPTIVRPSQNDMVELKDVGLVGDDPWESELTCEGWPEILDSDAASMAVFVSRCDVNVLSSDRALWITNGFLVPFFIVIPQNNEPNPSKEQLEYYPIWGLNFWTHSLLPISNCFGEFFSESIFSQMLEIMLQTTSKIIFGGVQ